MPRSVRFTNLILRWDADEDIISVRVRRGDVDDRPNVIYRVTAQVEGQFSPGEVLLCGQLSPSDGTGGLSVLAVGGVIQPFTVSCVNEFGAVLWDFLFQTPANPSQDQTRTEPTTVQLLVEEEFDEDHEDSELQEQSDAGSTLYQEQFEEVDYLE
jgi:hypothetical protein